MLSNPSILDVMALVAFVLGLVGQASLFAFPRDRRVLERALAVLFTLMVGGGVGLAWRADQLREADRDLPAAQFAGLSAAFAANAGLTYEVMWGKGDHESEALADRIVEAVKAGTGRPPKSDTETSTSLRGVVLGVRDREVGAGLAVDPIGRALMAARIATISDAVPDLPSDTMRIVVGRKP